MGFNISNMRFAKISRATTLSLAVSGTPQTVDLSTPLKNSNNLWEGVTNPSRITINRPGWYRVSAFVEFAASATGDRDVRIIKNGSATTILAQAVVKSATLITCLTISAPVYLIAGDFVQLVANQTSGGALDLIATALKECPNLSVQLVLPESLSSGAFERE